MKTRVAINGFGRIGRLALRNILARNDMQIVAVNDLADNATLTHLFQYDTVHGIYPAKVITEGDSMMVGRRSIAMFSERNPAKLPWKKLKVDMVLECTGVFRTCAKAGLHLEAGAKKVLLSAPAKDADIRTIVLGVNDDALSPRDKIISNASCTTNCLAPIVKIIDQNMGINIASVTTTHAYTSTQQLQDSPHADLRRARAAAANIIPTSTGAASAVAKVYPAIDGKLSATAMRVPVTTGSLIEMTAIIDKPVTAEQINNKVKSAARGAMKDILEYSEAPLVSSDIVGNQHSSIFDSQLTLVMGNMAKVVSWYDNEAGYAARLVDLVAAVKSLPKR